jgi:hypothetical protein
VKQKWEEYKELPESEKSRLNAEAARKPDPRPTPSKPRLPPNRQPGGQPQVTGTQTPAPGRPL